MNQRGLDAIAICMITAGIGIFVFVFPFAWQPQYLLVGLVLVHICKLFGSIA